MKVSIITHDMRMIQGSNRVTEKLVFGKKLFESYGIFLDKIYTKDEVISCLDYKRDTLGQEEKTVRYKRKRKIIDFLKKIPIYNSCLGSKWSINKNLRADKKAALQAIKNQSSESCVIIQGFYVAYYYLKLNKHDNTKTVMILHTDKDPLEQLLLKKPKLIGTKYENKLRNMFSFSLKNADRTVTICHSETDYLSKKFNYVATYITNGIEDVWFNDDFQTKFRCNDRFNFIIVATVQFRKGQDLLVEALKLMMQSQRDKIMLHIVGGGQDEEKIRNLIQDYGLNDCCKMHGVQQDVSLILREMDAFILPSRADTTPISIIEALRAGLPIIATEVGEVPYMIDGAGVIIKAEVESVKDSMLKCINNEYDLASMSQNSRKNFENNYKLDVMIKKYSQLINSIVA